MNKVNYIKKATLTWKDLKPLGMRGDSANRWDTTSDTPEWVKEYLKSVRTPSRAWPFSYAKAMLTQKFAKLLTENDPQLAVKLGVAAAATEQ